MIEDASVDTQLVWRGEHEGKLLGWFIVDEVIGKHEFITYAVAISPEGAVGKDIPNISGATLSCRNVVDGVRRLLVLHELVLKHE